MTVLIVVILLIALILLRIPVAFAVFATGLLGLVMTGGIDSAVHAMETSPFAAVRKNSLSAIPLFILMAQLMLMSGLMDKVFDAARALVGRMPGGTAVASVGAGTAFGAVSGSSTAAAATLAQTSTRRMLQEGYTKETSTALVAVVGTLAAMLPPSIILVFYAVTAEAPVGDMLIAGLLPGLLVAVSMLVVIAIGYFRKPDEMPKGTRTSMKEKTKLIVESSPMLLVFLCVVGAIFFGIVTPTESAAVGVLASLVIVLARKQWSNRGFGKAVLATVKTSAMIFAIIMSAHVLGDFLTETRVTPTMVDAIEDSGLPALAVVFLIALIYLVLGFFMDQIAIIALTVPVTLPLIEALGYDPVWFGVVVILLAETGMVTPPMGLNVFIVSRESGVPPITVFKGAFPYVIAMLVLTTIFILWPDLVLWLPSMAG
jgi:C4-dicarboxylate transporter DctM subunit